MATSTTTLNAKQINAGTREILGKTSQLTQVLRQFETLYSEKLASCDGLTVAAWMSAMGVERFTVTKKDGKVQKKGYTPGTIRKGWNTAMQTEGEKGKMCVFKNIPAKYKDEDDTVYRVFTPEEAAKIDGKSAGDTDTLVAITDLKAIKKLGLTFEKYNDRCWVLRGDTKPLRKILKEQFKGVFNSHLSGGEGWVIKTANVEECSKALGLKLPKAA